MLRYFFDNRANGAVLFKGLLIEKTPEFARHQGKYPMIFVSFKDIKFQNLADATVGLQKCFSELYREHLYVSAHVGGYYDEMVSFMRALMGAAFKDNSNLFKGVITGILRVSKEGMFSVLNNIDVYSLLSD